MMFKLIQKMMI